MPGDVEFIDTGDEPDGTGEEQLAHGPNRPWPRWLIAAGALVVAGAVAVVIANTGGGRSPNAASGQASGSPSDASGWEGTPVRLGPDSASANALDLALPHGGGIGSVAVVGGDLAVLAPGYLARVRDRAGRLRMMAASDVGLPLGDPHYGRWQLVTDGRDLWAVPEGPGGGQVTRVNPSTMYPDGRAIAAPPAQVVDASAFDGHLYVNTAAGVYDLAPSAPTFGAQPVTEGGGAMTVDPIRHRLLLLDLGDPSTIRAYSLRTHRTVAHATLPFRGQSLVVVDGTVWVAGTVDPAAPRTVIARLDPMTLRVIVRSMLGAQLAGTPGVPRLIAGKVDFWVRSADGLWCLDATTGGVAQQWSRLYGVVASRSPGQAFLGGGSIVRQLRLNGTCVG